MSVFFSASRNLIEMISQGSNNLSSSGAQGDDSVIYPMKKAMEHGPNRNRWFTH